MTKQNDCRDVQIQAFRLREREKILLAALNRIAAMNIYMDDIEDAVIFAELAIADWEHLLAKHEGAD